MPNTMRKFPKIFVAIDGYQPSIDIANYAIKIAKKDISELIALAVLNVSTPRRLSSSFITAQTYGLTELEEERKEAQQWLDTIAKRAEEREHNIDFKSDIIEESISKVGSAIVDYAKHENIDLIVMVQEVEQVLRRCCVEVLHHMS